MNNAILEDFDSHGVMHHTLNHGDIGRVHIEITKYELDWDRIQVNARRRDVARARRRVPFPTNVWECRRLRRLEIKNCPHSALPSDIEKLSRLTELSIENCDFDELPSSIGNLERLEKLVLYNCPFRDLPSSIKNLKNLETLEVSECPNLRNIPAEIGQIRWLKHLLMYDNNALRYIPPEIGKLENLELMEVASNPNLNFLPSEILAMNSLKTLQVRSWPGASISTSPSLTQCCLVNLEYLVVKDCDSLLTLPNEIGYLTNLRSLFISDCNKIDLIRRLAENPRNVNLPRGLRSLRIVRSPSSVTGKELDCIRNTLEYYDRCEAMNIFGYSLPAYDIYLSLFNQSGRILMRSHSGDGEDDGSSVKPIPLSVWPTVLDRARRVTRTRNHYYHGEENGEYEGTRLELEASIFFSFLHGPAFMSRTYSANHSPFSNALRQVESAIAKPSTRKRKVTKEPD